MAAVTERSSSLDELEQRRALVEAAIGRPLRQAELAIDVVLLNNELERAKNELHNAIEAAKRRAIRRGFERGFFVIEVTVAMLRPLERLFRLGRREGRAELQRGGYEVRRRLFAEPAYDDLRPLARKLALGLNHLSLRIEGERVSLDVSDAARSELVAALFRIPGGRSIAAGLVSSALIGGLGATFEQHSDLISCWEYTAVLDAGTCEVCEPLDGTEYHTLTELFQVLPEFGPNPLCLGRDRCRCRAVPCAT